jgi:dihydrofolate synthase/folylpolyglutamate synthase
MNAALAVAILRHQDRLKVPSPALGAAMGWADWPARLQRLARGPLAGSREVWLDGGHNPSAARQIAAFARHQFADGKPLHMIFASLTTKDPAGMLRPFESMVEQVHMVPIPGHSCFPPSDLAKVATKLGMAAETHEDFEQALESIPAEARVLIFGSLYLAGEVLAGNGEIPD